MPRRGLNHRNKNNDQDSYKMQLR